MSASTTIFRLCDEDDELDLGGDPDASSPLYDERPSRLRVDGPLAGPREPEPWAEAADPAAYPDADAGAQGWPSREPGEAENELFEWGSPDEEPEIPGRQPEDPHSSWLGPDRRDASVTARDARSWPSPRVLAVGAIAIVALLVVAIGHSARQAGRTPARQRPSAAAAVSANAGAPLPAPAATPRIGRRPAPRPPAAPNSGRRAAARRRHTRAPRRTGRKQPRTHRSNARPRPRIALAPTPQPAAAPTSEASAPVQVAAPPAAEPQPAPRPRPAHELPPAEFSFER